MKLILRVLLVSFFLLLSSQSFAWTNDYTSVFQPFKLNKSKSVAELQKGLEKDVVQVRSIMSVQTKKIINLIKSKENLKTTQTEK